MGSLNFASAVKKIYESNLHFFNLKTLRDVILIKKESTFFKYLKKLIDEKIIFKIERNKYLLVKAKISDFELANFLYYPSYISFETALNFFGLISQFPYEITSATNKKTKKKKYNNKIFTYIHLDKKLFFGYKKVGNFLIAYKEKALLDQLYLVSKGIKKINYEEIDFSRLNKEIFNDFLKLFPKTRQFLKIIENLKSYYDY